VTVLSGFRIGTFGSSLQCGDVRAFVPDEQLPSSPLPKAKVVPFRSFKNSYAGRGCCIVGKGPTEFCYEELGDLDEPIFFINDAICLENHARSDTYFFAHDAQMRPWLDGSIRSTAVLPRDGKILEGVSSGGMAHAGGVVYYSHKGQPRSKELLLMTRDEIADWQKLVIHSGTVHSALHFAWFCGVKRVTFIGCDGIHPGQVTAASPDVEYGYDPRLKNRSYSSPGPYYPAIRKAQDLLAALLDLETNYVGTPGRLNRPGRYKHSHLAA
jgi:hypothetical protein